MLYVWLPASCTAPPTLIASVLVEVLAKATFPPSKRSRTKAVRIPLAMVDVFKTWNP
jgi:hypothetical protein